MRTITLEEHYASEAFLEGAGRKLKEQAERIGGRAAKLIGQLCDLGDKRIAEMDAAGIDVQVLSLTSPGTEQLEVAEAVELARNRTTVSQRPCEAIPRVWLDSPRWRPRIRALQPTNWGAGFSSMVSRAR